MEQEKIGKFILQLRKEKGMTQKELAEKLGVTDRAISKWENGRGMPENSRQSHLSFFGQIQEPKAGQEKMNLEQRKNTFEGIHL